MPAAVTYQFTAYEKTFDGIFIRHHFRSQRDLQMWLFETQGLSIQSEGGRGFLLPSQEEKLDPKRTPNIYH